MKDHQEIQNSTSKIEMTGHKSAIYVVKFSKDGEYILSGSQDRTIKLWNPYKGFLINSYDIHSQDVLDLAIFQDNTKFASVGFDKQVYVVDSIKGNVMRRFYGHSGRINSIALNSLESVLVSGSYDCSVKIWDLKSQSKDPIQTLSHAKDSITKVIVLNEKIISVSVDGKMRQYDIRMGHMQIDDFEFSINGLDVSPDEKYFIVSGLDSNIKFFENDTCTIVKNFSGLHVSKNYSMTVKFANKLDGFFTTSENGNVIFYDLLDDKNNKVYKGHNKTSAGLDVHPLKNNLMVTCGYDAKIILWNV
jgi:mitogen-activated protein kinase organizer 1